MNGKHYELRFLPLFEDDLNGIVDYIAFRLKNPIAAEALPQLHHLLRRYRRCDGGSQDRLQPPRLTEANIKTNTDQNAVSFETGLRFAVCTQNEEKEYEQADYHREALGQRSLRRAAGRKEAHGRILGGQSHTTIFRIE